MSQPKPAVGSIGWIDLTVPDAEGIRDFYSDVVGWKPEALDMGGYSDFVMNGPDGQSVTGICHARGSNAYVPPQWMLYFVVADLDASLAKCEQRGGKRIGEVRRMGPEARYCVIQDPAGAVCVLFQA
jgi:predicted enzyme related to lactoylglutathione lyase